jgi:hypothetical protein
MPASLLRSGRALLVMALLTSCRRGSTEPVEVPALAVFTGTLSGPARDVPVSGTATYQAPFAGGAFALSLVPAQANGPTIYVESYKERPGAGAHRIGANAVASESPFVVLEGVPGTDYNGHWESTASSGSLELTRSSPTAMTGTLVVQVRSTLDPTRAPAMIRLTFDAACASTSGSQPACQ